MALCWCHLAFFIPTGEPKGGIFWSTIVVINACPFPSGVVPGDDAGGCGVEFIINSGVEGYDRVLQFLSRVLLVKVQDYAIIFFFLEFLLKNCKPAAPY
jgi:hypothetical protein